MVDEALDPTELSETDVYEIEDIDEVRDVPPLRRVTPLRLTPQLSNRTTRTTSVVVYDAVSVCLITTEFVGVWTIRTVISSP